MADLSCRSTARSTRICYPKFHLSKSREQNVQSKFFLPGVLDDGVPEVSATGLDDLEANVLNRAVVEVDVAERHVMEGAVLEETVYPADVFDGRVEGAAVVRRIGDETGPRFVFPGLKQLHILWEPRRQTVIPATLDSVNRASGKKS